MKKRNEVKTSILGWLLLLFSVIWFIIIVLLGGGIVGETLDILFFTVLYMFSAVALGLITLAIVAIFFKWKI